MQFSSKKEILIKWFINWLTSHIQNMDKKIGNYVKLISIDLIILKSICPTMRQKQQVYEL